MKLYFEIKSDDSLRNGEWLTIRAEREPYYGGTELGPGLRHVWFVLFRDELEAILAGKRCSAVDGYHKLEVMGDDWLFYDQEIPRENVGVMTCPFWRLTLPRTFMRALYRLARKTWRLMAEARAAGADRYDRVREVRVDVDPDHYARTLRLYGWGKGDVEVVTDETTRDFLALTREDAAKAGDRTLTDMLLRVSTIARNTTRGFHQTARVVLSKDWDGFYWQALAPNGSRVMNGGIVNHGAREGGHDWSIHT